MNYESLPDHSRIAKIGFGTSGVGGWMMADHSQDARAVAALRSALELGYTHFDTAEMYAGGHAEELIARAISETKSSREGLFITSKVQPMHLTYGGVKKACEGSLRRLASDYIDLYLVHWPNPLLPLKETFRALNELAREGKVRHVGVSNFSLGLLQQSQKLSEAPILADQVPYSLSHRSYVDNGVLKYCQENKIVLTAYSPMDRGHLPVSDTLRAIASAHGAGPFQIALAWLIGQPGVITIPMSLDPRHIAENLAAAEIELSTAEIDQLAGPHG
jgi:diketogulonate reductase-like aldo/keto reductase